MIAELAQLALLAEFAELALLALLAWLALFAWLKGGEGRGIGIWLKVAGEIEIWTVP